VADIAAGMYAYTSILSALLLRGKTGQGSHIDVSMLESLAEWMNYPLYYAYDGAPPPPRTAASHASIYPYGPFQAGRWWHGDAGPAERARVEAVLRRRAERCPCGHRPAL
jgi:crotonobetainyl-CoA:carnitine CoA-transferase CaiB-like acyl-CoA transferase